MEFNYYILDKTHPDYATCIADCTAQHKLYYPNNNLSVRDNIAGTQSLVKVARGSDAPPLAAVVVAEYTHLTHDQVVTLMQAPEWKHADI